MNPINESVSAISERLYYLLQDFEEEIEALPETDEKQFTTASAIKWRLEMSSSM